MLKGPREKAEALLAAERGAVFKARGAAVSVALAYPNTYHVGMSNLGVHQLYAILNRRTDTACERVFLPDEEGIEPHTVRAENRCSASRAAGRCENSISLPSRSPSSRTT